MSSSAKWRPAAPPPPYLGMCGVPLKSLLVKRLWNPEADGSLSYPDPRVLSLAKDGEWLRGVRDAGSEQLREQAQLLLSALEVHIVLEVVVET